MYTNKGEPRDKTEQFVDYYGSTSIPVPLKQNSESGQSAIKAGWNAIQAAKDVMQNTSIDLWFHSGQRADFYNPTAP